MKETATRIIMIVLVMLHIIADVVIIIENIKIKNYDLTVAYVIFILNLILMIILYLRKGEK